eukprot:4091593-Pyramimonas_sp.AAC.1
MCAALRRKPHFGNRPHSIRETLALVKNESARRYGENRMLKTTRPQSVKLMQMLKKKVCGAK